MVTNHKEIDTFIEYNVLIEENIIDIVSIDNMK